MKKRLLSLMLAVAMLAIVAVTTIAENTATDWSLDASETEVINIQTTFTGTNLIFHMSLFEGNEPIIMFSVPDNGDGNPFGSGTFDAYIEIGAYLVYIPIQGNEMGKHGRIPRIVDSAEGGHAWKLIDGKDPTCTTDGYAKYECQAHGEIKYVYKKAPGHDISTDKKDATCTEGGWHKESCARCKEVFRDETSDALGHLESRSEKQATCTEDGYLKITCTRCGATLEDTTFGATGHDWGDGWKVIKPATCIELGQEKKVCKNDSNHKRFRPIAKTPHTEGEGIITKEPTYEEDGEKSFYCTYEKCHALLRTEPIAKLSKTSFRVEFKLNGGTRTGGGELIQTVARGEAAVAPTAVRANFNFTGWDKTFANVTSDLIITAQWTATGTTGGDDDDKDDKEDDGKKDDDKDKDDDGDKDKDDDKDKKDPDNSGNPGTGSRSRGPGQTGNIIPPTPKPVLIEDDETPLGIPEGFIRDHVRYIKGYPEGTVSPEDHITRAETAEIVYRLLEASLNGHGFKNRFPDVGDSEWYTEAVTYLANTGIICGYDDGTFRPDRPITRAEFATMISRFDKLVQVDYNRFSDIGEDHWAVGYVNSAAYKGWVSGYPFGIFKPENYITRAEVISAINRMLKRMIEKENIPAWAVKFKDLSETHWAYAAIVEASNGHQYSRDHECNDYEMWEDKLQ